MSYIKTEWETGDKITAVKLNNVESGIEGINVSYEKTTWETGDKITAEKLNNIETGIEEAGSSDFSTANITVTADEPLIALGTFIVNDEMIPLLEMDTSGTIQAVLYKGECHASYEGENTISVSGDITYSDNVFVITGDGTITVQGSGVL